MAASRPPAARRHSDELAGQRSAAVAREQQRAAARREQRPDLGAVDVDGRAEAHARRPAVAAAARLVEAVGRRDDQSRAVGRRHRLVFVGPRVDGGAEILDAASAAPLPARARCRSGRGRPGGPSRSRASRRGTAAETTRGGGVDGLGQPLRRRPRPGRVTIDAPDVERGAGGRAGGARRDEVERARRRGKERIRFQPRSGERRRDRRRTTRARRTSTDEDAPAGEVGGAAHEVEIAGARIEGGMRLEAGAGDAGRRPRPHVGVPGRAVGRLGRQRGCRQHRAADRADSNRPAHSLHKDR